MRKEDERAKKAGGRRCLYPQNCILLAVALPHSSLPLSFFHQFAATTFKNKNYSKVQKNPEKCGKGKRPAVFLPPTSFKLKIGQPSLFIPPSASLSSHTLEGKPLAARSFFCQLACWFDPESRRERAKKRTSTGPVFSTPPHPNPRISPSSNGFSRRSFFF